MDVLPIAEARAGLTGAIAAFRHDPLGPPIVMGSHRRPEAVLVSFAEYTQRLRMQTTETGPSMLDVLREKSPLVKRLARLSHISSVAVFGSVARGEESAASDVDLLVDVDDDASLFDLAQFEIDIEMLLGRPVDVVSRRALGPGDDAVVRQAVSL